MICFAGRFAFYALRPDDAASTTCPLRLTIPALTSCPNAGPCELLLTSSHETGDEAGLRHLQDSMAFHEGWAYLSAKQPCFKFNEAFAFRAI